MTVGNEVTALTETALAAMNIEDLTGLLVQKTEHLLVASRCRLPDPIIQPIRQEVKMLQAAIMRRGTSHGNTITAYPNDRA